MPGESTNVQVNLPDQKVVAEAFDNKQWPQPQLATIKNGSMTLVNTSKYPVREQSTVSENNTNIHR